MAGKLMRYPTDMIDSSMDYFKIEILKNIKQGGGFGNISSLAGGMYYVSILNEGHVSTEKFVIEK